MPRSRMTDAERRVYDEAMRRGRESLNLRPSPDYMTAEMRRSLGETLRRYQEYVLATRTAGRIPLARSTTELRRAIERAPIGTAIMFDEAGQMLVEREHWDPAMTRERFNANQREAQRALAQGRYWHPSAADVVAGAEQERARSQRLATRKKRQKMDCWNEESEK